MNRKLVADGVQSLIAALDALNLVADELEARVKNLAPGCPEEQTLLKLRRACGHLMDAAADLPTEAYVELVHERMAGGREVIERVNALLERTGKAVAA